MAQPARGNRAPLRDSMQFLGTFVRNPRTVGAVLPSSRQLARALAADLPVSEGGLVLEYGPGTGPVTQAIVEALPAGAHYLGIERDAGFCARLRQRFPALAFHHGSVEHVEEIVAAHHRGQPAAIVSGLPFASLPVQVQQAVVGGTAAVLADGGEFRTFQYVHAYGLPAAVRFRRAMAERFSGFRRSRAILANVPPAFVLYYSK